MHYFVYSNKSAWISSGSNKITGITEADQNFGKDPILELKKEFYNNSFDYPTRIFLQFDLTDLEKKRSMRSSAGKVPSVSATSFYIRLYEAEGNKDLSQEYTLIAHPLSQSWDEGVGKFGDSSKVTNGVSWDYRNNKQGSTATTWTNNIGNDIKGGNYMTASLTTAASADAPTSGSQTFSYESPDVNMDITPIVNHWLDGRIPNNGLVLKFSGSQETDSATFGNLKFFSNDTHTIYSPRIEVKWRNPVLNIGDHYNCAGTNTGSMLPLTMSGEVDNYLYMKGLREYYRESEYVKFRVGARKRYIQKTFTNSVQTVTGSYIPQGSGSYSILDIATGETIVPFGTYSSMSCDPQSNYFDQHLDGFQPDRTYKILYKIKYDDEQEVIYDENWEFKIRRK